MTSLERTAGNTFIYMLGLIANRGVAFLLVPLYTRTFEPGVFAALDLSLVTIIFLIPVFELGMNAALVRFYHYWDTPEGRQNAVSTALSFVLLSSATLTSMAFVYAAPLAHAIFGDATQDHIVRLIAVVVALTAVSNQALALLRAQERSMAFAALNLVRAVVGPAAIIALVVGRGMEIEGVLYGDIAGLAVMTLAGLWITRAQLGLGLNGTALRSMLAFGAPLIPWAVTLNIITLSDRYLLRVWNTPEELAIYSLGFKAGMIMTLFTRAFQTAWPASAYSIAKESGASEQLATAGRYVFALTALAASALALLAPELVAVLGGAFYTPAVAIVPWIVFSYAIYQLTLFLLTVVTITNKNLYVAAIALTTVGVKLGLSFALIPAYGAHGAAWSTFGSFTVLLGLSYAVAQRVYFVPYALRLMGAYALILALCQTAAHTFASEATIGHTALRLALLAGLGALTVVMGLAHKETVLKLAQPRRLFNRLFRARP